jgi:hypothetical protein
MSYGNPGGNLWAGVGTAAEHTQVDLREAPSDLSFTRTLVLSRRGADKSKGLLDLHSASAQGGGFLVRILVLVGAPRGRTGPFVRLPGRGGHLGGPATSHQVGWSGEASGSRGGAPGGAALTFAPGRAAGAVFFSSRGVPSETSG